MTLTFSFNLGLLFLNYFFIDVFFVFVSTEENI